MEFFSSTFISATSLEEETGAEMGFFITFDNSSICLQILPLSYRHHRLHP
jgi:hypothetical protein